MQNQPFASTPYFFRFSGRIPFYHFCMKEYVIFVDKRNHFRPCTNFRYPTDRTQQPSRISIQTLGKKLQ